MAGVVSGMAGSIVRTGTALACALALAFQPGGVARAADPADGRAGAAPSARDGRHDFDFEFGTWTTHLRRLERPLSGSTTWLEYRGTSVVRPILGGRANLVELEVEGPAGRLEGVALRLYHPSARQWSMHYANLANGIMTRPVVGAFSEGVGEFYGQETVDGRAVLVRFVISDVTPDSARFEQAFSIDGGRTWEVNWIALDTRSGEPDRP